MNPGYLSMIIICIVMILLFSGWKAEILPNVSSKMIIIFFIGWFGCSYTQTTMLWLSLFVLWVFIRVRTSHFGVPLISHSVFIASMYSFMHWIYLFAPEAVLYRADWDAALLTGVIVACSTTVLLRQLAVISCGLILGELIWGWMSPFDVTFTWGDAAFQDVWWLAVFAARFIALMISYSRRTWNQVKHIRRWH